MTAVLLCISASCRNPDWPRARSQIVLQAFTSSAAPAGATDSIGCSIYVLFPIDDSIPSAWSGPAEVHVGRWPLRGTAGPPNDSLLSDVPVEIASRSTDSLRVTIRSPTPMSFDGRFIGADAAISREGTGTWTCDDRVPLAGAVPGKASGAWYLFVSRPID